MTSKIHTLADIQSKPKNLKKKLKINSKNKVAEAEKLIKNTKYKKDAKWHDNIQHLINLSKSVDDTDNLVLCPIGLNSKTPELPFNKKWSRNTDTGYKKTQLWSWDDWHSIDNDRSNSELGMLIRGEVGVIDWDSQESFDWFISSFISEKHETDYNIYTSDDDGGQGHKGGHIIFKIDAETKTLFEGLNKSKWLSKPDFSTFWNTEDEPNKGCVDLLKEASTTSPVVVKLPSMLEGSKKKWIHKSDSLMPLPQEFKKYISEHRWKPAKTILCKTQNRFIIDLLNLIPKDIDIIDFKDSDYKKILMECLKQGVSLVEFYAWSSSLALTKKFPNHKSYVDNLWSWAEDNADTTGNEMRTTIRMVQKHNGKQYEDYMTAYLEGGKTEVFSRQFISLLDVFYDEDCRMKCNKIMKYMNKYFVATTGMSKNMYYFKTYDKGDRLLKIKFYQDIASFHFATSIKFKINEDGDRMAVGKYWEDRATNRKHAVVNTPYGINHKVISENLNTFCGYKMRYDRGYNDHITKMLTPTSERVADDELGDRIDKHFREVICDNNEEVINWMRGYFYKMIFEGKRPKVAVFCCSMAQGSGKSMFVDGFAKHVVGQGQSRVIQSFAKMCQDTFTDYYDDASFILLEEIPKFDSSKSSGMFEELKSLITENTQSSRKFLQAPSQIDNNTSWWFNSNHPFGLCPEIVIRRFICLEVSADKVGDFKYFNDLAEAVEDSEAWVNWFHRHIIAKRNEFEHCVIEPIAKCIPMTPLKKRITTRRIDNFTLFFKYLVYESEWYDPENEDKHAYVRDKKIDISVLFQYYTNWKEMNQITEDWCNDITKFSKKLNQHFYMEEENLTTMSAEDIEAMKKKKKTYLEVKRNTRGKYVQFDSSFLAVLDNLIGDNKVQVVKYIEKKDILDTDLLKTLSSEIQFDEDNDLDY